MCFAKIRMVPFGLISNSTEAILHTISLYSRNLESRSPDVFIQRLPLHPTKTRRFPSLARSQSASAASDRSISTIETAGSQGNLPRRSLEAVPLGITSVIGAVHSRNQKVADPISIEFASSGTERLLGAAPWKTTSSSASATYKQRNTPSVYAARRSVSIALLHDLKERLDQYLHV
jgi:hypothetical protein